MMHGGYKEANESRTNKEQVNTIREQINDMTGAENGPKQKQRHMTC